jgi:hypothetical protein
MYKFTNGIVVFDEETKDKYINAGMTLVKEEKKVVEEDRPNRLQERGSVEERTATLGGDASGRLEKNNSKVRK